VIHKNLVCVVSTFFTKGFPFLDGEVFFIPLHVCSCILRHRKELNYLEELSFWINQ
jgi:hypothetical protein